MDSQDEPRPEERQKGLGKNPRFIIWPDDDIIQGCQTFSVIWMGEEATRIAGHGPHIHKYPEVPVALGTDNEHPGGFGCGDIDVYGFKLNETS